MTLCKWAMGVSPCFIFCYWIWGQVSADIILVREGSIILIYLLLLSKSTHSVLSFYLGCPHGEGKLLIRACPTSGLGEADRTPNLVSVDASSWMGKRSPILNPTNTLQYTHFSSTGTVLTTVLTREGEHHLRVLGFSHSTLNYLLLPV